MVFVTPCAWTTFMPKAPLMSKVAVNTDSERDF